MTKIPIPRGYAFDVLRRVVKRRYDDVAANPELKQTDRWDLSNCFYLTRKILDGEGYDTAPLNDRERRESIHSKVREICEDELGLKRHEIGIFAAERAVMAFQGELYNVNIDNIDWLRQLGTDLIIVEKEGIVDKLVPFTTEYGIALLYSRGFVSEYGEMLAEQAELYGANIGIVTDFDASGVDIGAQLTKSSEDEVKRLVYGLNYPSTL